MSARLERIVGKYVHFLQRGKWMVLLSWGILTLLLGIFGATRLMGHCHNSFDPPPGSASATAEDKMQKYFPGSDANSSDIIYVEAHAGSSVFDNALLKNITDACETYLAAHLTGTMSKSMTLNGYYSYMKQGLPATAATLAFVGKANSSSFLVMQYPKNVSMLYGRVLQGLQKVLRAKYVGLGKAAFVGDVGVAFQAVEATQAAIQSMTHMDLISLPLAFVVLAISLRSARLLILPLLTLGIGACTAFGVMGVLAEVGLSVSSATPPLMMSMLLAVSIDYALFLLTRFKEEIEDGSPINIAVLHMLVYSGHTVCGSGFTLAFCFVALLFFPLQMMQSIGLGVIVSIFSAIAVNLTIVPAGLLAFPSFFTNFESFGCSCFCSSRLRRSRTGDVEQSAMVPLRVSSPFEAKAWFRWATYSTSICATSLVLFLLISVGGVSLIKFGQIHTSMDTLLMAPRDSISVETMKHFGQSFSMGRTGPYQLLLLPTSSHSIYDEAFWADATNLLNNILAQTYTGDSLTRGTLTSAIVNYNLDGQQHTHNIALDQARFLDPSLRNNIPCKLFPLQHSSCTRFAYSKRCGDLGNMTQALAQHFGMPAGEVVEACRLAQAILQSTTTKTRDALYATLMPSDPMGSESAVAWTKKCRDVLSNRSQYPHVEAHLNGFTANMLDSIEAINDRTPTILAFTMVACFILISILVISLAFGLSSVILISWTIIIVFSIGVLIYQDGILGASAPPQLAGTGGIAWIVPPLTFTVILGLGLDYDIFLLGRVCEYRCNGYTDKEALAYGVAKTGPVITSAGIIMAVAFAGLMMSPIPMLNQVSLLLVVAVLVDTFFIRSLATPAVHAPLRGLNWWPRKVPLATSFRTQLSLISEETVSQPKTF